jgi:hypothetical protein
MIQMYTFITETINIWNDVGTNNISSAQNVDTIIFYYGDLIHKLKYKTNAHIVCTSILPRLCDHDKTSFQRQQFYHPIWT